MHIAEGVLPPEALGAGVLAAAAGVAIGLRRLDEDEAVRAGVLSAAFFTASFIHIPIGPASVHLVLTGLMGLLLGWAAFPAVLVALTLQAILFGMGGLTVLGVNTVIMAAPAVACYHAFRRDLAQRRGPGLAVRGFLAGALTVALSVALLAGFLLTAGREFAGLAQALAAAYIPVIIIEGGVTAAAAGFLVRVRPQLFAPREEISGHAPPG